MARLILALALLASPAAAQTACAPHADMAALLAERWGETREWVALDRAGQMVEGWASDAGTWTVTVTTPADLRACIVAAGIAYEEEPEGDPA